MAARTPSSVAGGVLAFLLADPAKSCVLAAWVIAAVLSEVGGRHRDLREHVESPSHGLEGSRVPEGPCGPAEAAA